MFLAVSVVEIQNQGYKKPFYKMNTYLQTQAVDHQTVSQLSFSHQTSVRHLLHKSQKAVRPSSYERQTANRQLSDSYFLEYVSFSIFKILDFKPHIFLQ